MTYPPVVHFKTPEGTACDQQRNRRWSSKNITSTKNWDSVDCCNCLKKRPA